MQLSPESDNDQWPDPVRSSRLLTMARFRPESCPPAIGDGGQMLPDSYNQISNVRARTTEHKTHFFNKKVGVGDGFPPLQIIFREVIAWGKKMRI
jgi:hypothetical protein